MFGDLVSYTAIFFDVMTNPTRATSGRPSIALQPLARKTRRGRLKQQFVTLEVLLIQDQSDFSLGKSLLVSGRVVENCFLSMSWLNQQRQRYTALLRRGKHPWGSLVITGSVCLNGSLPIATQNIIKHIKPCCYRLPIWHVTISCKQPQWHQPQSSLFWCPYP